MIARSVEQHEPPATGSERRFYSVPEAARMIGTAPVTLYRAIRENAFPAVRIRGRLVVPAQALDAMVENAINECSTADASSWIGRDGDGVPG